MSEEKVEIEVKKEEKTEEIKEKKVDPRVQKKLEAKEKREKERTEQMKLKEEKLNVVISFEDLIEGKVKFGKYPLIQSNHKFLHEFHQIENANKDMDQKEVTFRARIHKTRDQGKGVFVELRQGCYTIQAVAFEDENIPKQMVQFISCQTRESIVDVCGVIVFKKEQIESTSQKDVELNITKFFTVVTAISPLPLLIEDSMKPEPKEGNEKNEDEEKKEEKVNSVSQDVRLNNRVLDLRAPANIAIFKIQGGVGYFFRKFLHKEDFIEIHTPKLIGTASEGGADVFELKYFDTSAYLAQSPQLFKQMAVTFYSKKR
jgi:aspartyl-tRNA synthetase